MIQATAPEGNIPTFIRGAETEKNRLPGNSGSVDSDSLNLYSKRDKKEAKVLEL